MVLGFKRHIYKLPRTWIKHGGELWRPAMAPCWSLSERLHFMFDTCLTQKPEPFNLTGIFCGRFTLSPVFRNGVHNFSGTGRYRCRSLKKKKVISLRGEVRILVTFSFLITWVLKKKVDCWFGGLLWDNGPFGLCSKLLASVAFGATSSIFI